MKSTIPLIFFLLFSFALKAIDSGEESATAKRIPWGGYWWPMQYGETALGWESNTGRVVWTEKEAIKFNKCLWSKTDACKKFINSSSSDHGRKLSPLMKYDLFVKRVIEKDPELAESGVDMQTFATQKELDIHYIGNNTNHPLYENAGFAGKCIGWSLSTFDYDEPTKEKIIMDIVFEPADIKAILATFYSGSIFFISEKDFLGNQFLDIPGENSDKYYNDVLPHDFIKGLYKTIKKGKMLEGDLDPGHGVWNYPIYKYDLSWKNQKENWISVQATIWFADDEVEVDDVFSTKNDRTDIKSRNYSFDLKMPANWNGKDLSLAVDGKWSGESVDNHPDTLLLKLESDWRENIITIGTDDPSFNGWLATVNESSGELFFDELIYQYYK